MDDPALEELQIKLAYLEQANNELSDVVVRQQHEIRELERRMAALAERVRSLHADESPRETDDERPPHY